MFNLMLKSVIRIVVTLTMLAIFVMSFDWIYGV